MLRYQQARLGELTPLFAAMSESAPTLLTWHAARALAHTEAGEWEQGQQVIDELLAADYYHRTEEPHWLIGMSCLGSALAAVGTDTTAMSTAYDALASRAPMFASIMPLSLGSQERVMGELAFALGRLDEATTHFLAAVEANERAPAPAFTARSQVGLIRCRLARGATVDDPEIIELIQAVRGAVERYGLTRVNDLLNAALT
jgi:hypothetical protein